MKLIGMFPECSVKVIKNIVTQDTILQNFKKQQLIDHYWVGGSIPHPSAQDLSLS